MCVRSVPGGEWPPLLILLRAAKETLAEVAETVSMVVAAVKRVVWPLAATLALSLSGAAAAQAYPDGFVPNAVRLRAQLGRHLTSVEYQRCVEADQRELREHAARTGTRAADKARQERRQRNADLLAERRLADEEGLVAAFVTGPPPEPPKPPLSVQMQQLDWWLYVLIGLGLVALCRPRKPPTGGEPW